MRSGTLQAIFLAGAMTLAGSLMAQTGAMNGSPPGDLDAALARAEAARLRLDLPMALDVLTGAVEASPQADAPLIARAAIHRAMGRPSLALADLNTVLARAPDDARALAQRAETWRRSGVFDKAVQDYARARALRPDDADLAAGEAAALRGAGRKDEALAAYVRACDLAPEDDRLCAARNALMTELARTMQPGFVFEAGALVGEEFTIGEGAATAPNHLIQVRDGAALASKGAVTPDRLTRAVAAGVLRITHVFTYSGRNSTIWANLALICAGPALGVTEAALMSVEGRRALEDTDNGRGTDALAALIAGAYDLGGQDGTLVGECALDRGHALAYLADWTRAQERIGWRGETYLDRAPSYVLNGKPVTAGWLDAWLAAQLPPPAARGAATPRPAGDRAPDSAAPAETVEPGADSGAAGGDGAEGGPETAQAEGGRGDGAGEDALPAAVLIADTALAQITVPPPQELPPMDGGAARPGEIVPDDPGTTPVDRESDVAEASGEDGTGPVAEPAGTTPAPPSDPAGEAEPETPVETEAPGDAAEDRTDPGTAPEGIEPAPPPPEQTEAAEPDAPAGDAHTDAPQAEPAESGPRDDTPGNAGPESAAPAAPAPGAGAGTPVDDVRLARILKGIWAPSLAQCLSYLDAIETPETLDQAMPDPAADPPLGAMLITSRRAQPFDAGGLVCVTESFTETGNESDAVLTCTRDGSDAGTMRLHAYPSGGPAPWLDVIHGEAETRAMRQCLTLGQLGVRFADLWRIDLSTCTARAPLAGIALDFRPDDGGMWLSLHPETAGMALPGPQGLTAAIDNVALTPSAGRLEDGIYRIRLGPFEDVAHHLSFGMFLHLSASGDSGFRALRLPLLGSGRAMAALSGCAG